MTLRSLVYPPVFLLIIASSSLAQYLEKSSYAPAPKRELRGAWIATVSNVDWPLSSGQSWLNQALDSLASVGINTIFFQVRPSCDAFYASSIEPWSQWITGSPQGTNPGYDPLQYVVDACHARGMEIHAWFNPYRAALDSLTIPNMATTHIARVHPEWLLGELTTRLKILNPGLPEVRAYVMSVIIDVVRRYDIDGVHFDDYFYPYGGIGNQDYDLWANSGSGLSLGDWRRENVNIFIRSLQDSVHAVKPKIKYGVSPFGIWRNQGSDPNGSATNGNQSYDTQYADTRKWLQEGWIDYLVPQIYWPFSLSVAPYGVLTDWWNANAASRQIYIGLATYRAIGYTSGWTVKELLNQIDYNRSKPNVFGAVHFSSKYFQKNSSLLNDSLRSSVYPKVTSETVRRPLALLPTMAWRDAVVPCVPDSFRIQPSAGKTYAFVKWNVPPPASDGDTPVMYLLYSSTTLPIDFSDLSKVVYAGTGTNYTKFPSVGDPTVYYYAVTSLDRRHNESLPSQVLGWSYGGNVVGVEETPALPAEFVLLQNFPNPFNPETIIPFSLQREAFVTLKVYDVLGREVAALVNEVRQPGSYQVTFQAQRIPSGVYFYRLTAEGKAVVRKMQVLK